jgi:hypothetical protein
MTFIPRNDNSIHRKDLGLKDPWAPRQRDEHEALPSTLSIWDRPVYQPPKDQCARPGAMDHKKVKSK